MTLGSYLLYRMLIRIASGPEKRTLRRLAGWADDGDREARARFQGIMNRLLWDYCYPVPPAEEEHVDRTVGLSCDPGRGSDRRLSAGGG